jgi:hypothetical protein
MPRNNLVLLQCLAVLDKRATFIGRKPRPDDALAFDVIELVTGVVVPAQRRVKLNLRPRSLLLAYAAPAGNPAKNWSIPMCTGVDSVLL